MQLNTKRLSRELFRPFRRAVRICEGYQSTNVSGCVQRGLPSTSVKGFPLVAASATHEQKMHKPQFQRRFVSHAGHVNPTRTHERRSKSGSDAATKKTKLQEGTEVDNALNDIAGQIIHWRDRLPLGKVIHVSKPPTKECITGSGKGLEGWLRSFPKVFKILSDGSTKYVTLLESAKAMGIGAPTPPPVLDVDIPQALVNLCLVFWFAVRTESLVKCGKMTLCPICDRKIVVILS